MKISVTCPSCNSQLNAPDKLAGKTVACPKCKTKVQIPDKPSSVRADSSPREPVPDEGRQEDASSFGELIPLGDESAQKPISLTKKEMLVGRHKDCDITLPFQTVSGNHCKLILNPNGYWYVRNLKNRNSIMVNGVTVEKKKLQPGDVLTLGMHEYEIRFQVKNRDPVKSSDEEASFSGIMRGVIDWESVVEKEKADLLSKDKSDSEKGEKPSTIDNQQKCKEGNFMPVTFSRKVRLDAGESTQSNVRILSCGNLSLNAWMSCQMIQTESMTTKRYHPARKLEIIRPDGVVAAQQSFQHAEVNLNGDVTLDYTINSNDPAGLWQASVTLVEQNEHLVKLTLTHPSIVQI